MSVLSIIQSKLNAPKNQYNSFGKYNYRSCEDILLALKPLLAEHQATILLSDEVVAIGNSLFLKATATLKCGDEIEFVCDGDDESEALQALINAVDSGLGE